MKWSKSTLTGHEPNSGLIAHPTFSHSSVSVLKSVIRFTNT